MLCFRLQLALLLLSLSTIMWRCEPLPACLLTFHCAKKLQCTTTLLVEWEGEKGKDFESYSIIYCCCSILGLLRHCSKWLDHFLNVLEAWKGLLFKVWCILVFHGAISSTDAYWRDIQKFGTLGTLGSLLHSNRLDSPAGRSHSLLGSPGTLGSLSSHQNLFWVLHMLNHCNEDEIYW